MLSNVVLIIALVLPFSQAADLQGAQHGGKAMDRSYEEIDGATYYFDMVTRFYRDDAKTACESLNMTLISFEDGVQKWEAINTWILDNGFDGKYFWIDAMRDEGSHEWYWETSGNKIAASDYHWGLSQPSMDDNLWRTCINFSIWARGYNDDDCLINEYYLLCEYSK